MARITAPYVMSVAQVKTYLQISGTDYDTQIATYLPVVSKDIELITNNSFIVEMSGDIEDASQTVSNIGTEKLDIGNIVCTIDFVQNAITAIDDDAKELTLTTAATSTETETDVLVNIFPTAKKPIAAAMVLHNIRKYSASMAFDGPLKSESVGSYSWTAANEGKGAAGYPQWMVDALKEITIPRFY